MAVVHGFPHCRVLVLYCCLVVATVTVRSILASPLRFSCTRRYYLIRRPRTWSTTEHISGPRGIYTIYELASISCRRPIRSNSLGNARDVVTTRRKDEIKGKWESARTCQASRSRIVAELGITNLPDHPPPQVWHIHLGEPKIIFLPPGDGL